jgi:hypothetical protein
MMRESLQITCIGLYILVVSTLSPVRLKQLSSGATGLEHPMAMPISPMYASDAIPKTTLVRFMVHISYFSLGRGSNGRPGGA